MIVGTSAVLSAIHGPPARSRAAGGTSQAIAWVADPHTSTGAVVPIRKTGSEQAAITITPDGRTAYVVNSGSGTVTSIQISNNTALRPIKVGGFPTAILIIR